MGCWIGGCPDGVGEALRGEPEGGEGVLGDLDYGLGWLGWRVAAAVDGAVFGFGCWVVGYDGACAC